MSVVNGGIYEHYKKKLYKVIGVATHSETLEKLVVYQPLYGESGLWVRPEQMFCDQVNKDGKMVERFRYIGNDADDNNQCN